MKNSRFVIRSILFMSLAASFALPDLASADDGLPDSVLTEAQLPDDPDMEGSPNNDPVVANPDRTLDVTAMSQPATSPKAQASILEKYKHVDPSKKINRGLLEKALQYFDANLSKFPNKAYLGVVDFSKKSNKARWFIITLKTGAVQAIHVAHGSQSDKNGDGIPETFSNTDGSNMSSLGVYRTAEPYESAKFGHSMRIDGLSTTNSNVRSRAIVVHPAWYVWESDAISPGRTYGCLGISKSVSKNLIDQIQRGSMIYVGLSAAK